MPFRRTACLALLPESPRRTDQSADHPDLARPCNHYRSVAGYQCGIAPTECPAHRRIYLAGRARGRLCRRSLAQHLSAGPSDQSRRSARGRHGAHLDAGDGCCPPYQGRHRRRRNGRPSGATKPERCDRHRCCRKDIDPYRCDEAGIPRRQNLARESRQWPGGQASSRSAARRGT